MTSPLAKPLMMPSTSWSAVVAAVKRTVWLPVAKSISAAESEVKVQSPLSTATFALRNTSSAGAPFVTFGFGVANLIPIEGDWNGDGIDSVGIFDPATNNFFLTNTNGVGAVSDFTFSFGIGVGTIVLAVNVTMLSGYALGCHSMRHLIGGGKDELKRAVFGRAGYNCVNCLNSNHMKWAWGSLFWVAFSDLYVRLCSLGVLTDWRIL